MNEGSGGNKRFNSKTLAIKKQISQNLQRTVQLVISVLPLIINRGIKSLSNGSRISVRVASI